MKKPGNTFQDFINLNKWILNTRHGKWSLFLFLHKNYTGTLVITTVGCSTNAYSVATRNQWARDDPAFMILLIPWIFGMLGNATSSFSSNTFILILLQLMNFNRSVFYFW